MEVMKFFSSIFPTSLLPYLHFRLTLLLIQVSSLESFSFLVNHHSSGNVTCGQVTCREFLCVNDEKQMLSIETIERARELKSIEVLKNGSNEVFFFNLPYFITSLLSFLFDKRKNLTTISPIVFVL
jgi:hypothetical protein